MPGIIIELAGLVLSLAYLIHVKRKYAAAGQSLEECRDRLKGLYDLRLRQKRRIEKRLASARRLPVIFTALFLLNVVSMILAKATFPDFPGTLPDRETRSRRNAETEYRYDPANYFHLVEKNEEMTERERILYEGLLGSWQSDLQENGSAAEKRNRYTGRAVEAVSVFGMAPSPDLTDEKDNGGKAKNVDAVSEKIKACGDPMAVPHEIYEEEFDARSDAYIEYPSGENAYQTGRAANDVFDTGGDMPLTVRLYYASFAVQYYLESLKYAQRSESEMDIYYKIGILLYKLSENQELKDYKEHFQYASCVFFFLCREYNKELDNLCAEYQTYYYGNILYKIGVQNVGENQGFLSDSRYYLTLYLEDSRSRREEERREEYEKSCEYLISSIDDRLLSDAGSGF